MSQFKTSSTSIATSPQKLDNSHEVAMTIAEAADDRKAEEIVILRVAEVSYLADYFVIVTGFSRAQVRAIAQTIEQKVETQWQRLPVRTQGQSEGSWVVQDYGDVIVHILLPQEREFYNLEAFWGHGEKIEFQTGPAAK
ncbi:MAG: ribosome silencing factor [Coleofasciculaceae cyanobacterium]